jgi:hypothetical protein
MKSIVELEINAPRRDVAALMADPGNMPQWMDDLARIEEVSGTLGLPGSRFRMLGKPGSAQADFVVTVTARHLPDLFALKLESDRVDVAVTTTLMELSAARTTLRSEEVFAFHELFNTVFGFFAQNTIRKHHRTHIESFGRFAEARLGR